MWDGQGRAPRLPRNWRIIRADVLRRDGHRCRATLDNGARCTRRATDVDHLEPMRDDHNPDALQSLCADHHRQKTGREGAAASAATKRATAARRHRPQPPHPGLIR